jgi:ribosomal-protein-alanine N-acetyltransferase
MAEMNMEAYPLLFRWPESEEEKKTAAKMMAETDPWITLGISKEQILKTLDDPLYETYLALAGKEIAGVAVIQLKGACTGYLKSIAVKKAWRHRQVGSRLMDFIEEKIFSVQPNVFLCVSSFNTTARRFYEKRGYEEIGILKNYLVRGYDEVFMRKSLGPVIG